MSFWACALTEAHRERTAVRFLTMGGYTVYCPMLGFKRGTTPLFPGYCFILIAERGWWTARGTIGVRSIVGAHIGEPARVPDSIITGLRARERKGLIVLPTKSDLKRGDYVRIRCGAFAGHLAIYDGQRPHERVAILLAFLGSEQRMELARRDVEPVPKTNGA
jgi:transcription antitermination factor NusG